MKINDAVYGDVSIDEPVLCQLLEAPSIIRLKNISQQGLPRRFYYKDIFTRFDHSVGVMVLLRNLGASVEEQIAGLLHDISHTAFSHLVDWVFADPTTQSYQDNTYQAWLKRTEIPGILEEFGYDVKDFLELENYTLLEQKNRSLSADRLDYTLREAALPNPGVILDHAVVCEGKIVFDSVESAWEFGLLYARMQAENWGGAKSMARYHVLGELLKYAVAKEIVSKEDFMTTDEKVIGKLEQSKNERVLLDLSLLKNLKVEYTREGIELLRMYRYIDPDVLVDSKVIALSELSDKYREFLEEQRVKHESLDRVKISKITGELHHNDP